MKTKSSQCMISKESYSKEYGSFFMKKPLFRGGSLFAKELNDKEKINLVRYIVLMSKNS